MSSSALAPKKRNDELTQWALYINHHSEGKLYLLESSLPNSLNFHLFASLNGLSRDTYPPPSATAESSIRVISYRGGGGTVGKGMQPLAAVTGR
jgi:hypothetical protein